MSWRRLRGLAGVGYAVFLLLVGLSGSTSLARRTAARSGRWRSGGVHLPRGPRRLGLPRGPVAVAAVVRPGQPGDALPGQPHGLQRLPGQGDLHHVATTAARSAATSTRGRARRPSGSTAASPAPSSPWRSLWPAADHDRRPERAASSLLLRRPPAWSSSWAACRCGPTCAARRRLPRARRGGGTRRHRSMAASVRRRGGRRGARPTRAIVASREPEAAVRAASAPLGGVGWRCAHDDRALLVVVLSRAGRGAGPRFGPGAAGVRARRGSSASADCVHRWRRGCVVVLPGLDKLVRVDLRVVTLTIPPQEVITQGQRSGPGERGRAVPGHRPGPVGDGGGEPRRRDVPDRADHAALGGRPGGPRHAARPPRRPQRGPGRTIAAQTEPWGVKVGSWRSRTWRSPRRCSGRWRERPRPSASGAPR